MTDYILYSRFCINTLQLILCPLAVKSKNLTPERHEDSSWEQRVGFKSFKTRIEWVQEQQVSSLHEATGNQGVSKENLLFRVGACQQLSAYCLFFFSFSNSLDSFMITFFFFKSCHFHFLELRTLAWNQLLPNMPQTKRQVLEEDVFWRNSFLLQDSFFFFF